MSLLLYLIPLIVFVITSIVLYFISKQEDKDELGTVFLRNILPAALLSILVFVIIKFKDSQLFSPEPMMPGNYFD